MEALKMYESVLRELDRFGSPRYDINDHNYFVNVSKDQVVDEIIKAYELTQEITEMLQGIIVSYDIVMNANDRTSHKTASLRAYFDNLKGVMVRFRYIKDFECHKKGDRVEFSARRMTTDAKGFAVTNNYYKPSLEKENIYYTVRDKKITILYDTLESIVNYAILDNVWVEHTVHPADIILGQDKSNVANSTLHRKVNRAIIMMTSSKFLENSKNQRVQTFNQINQ